MVVDDHEVARTKRGVDAARRVRQNECLHAERAEHTCPKVTVRRSCPLIQMVRPDSTAPVARDVAETIRPSCPITFVTGQFGFRHTE